MNQWPNVRLRVIEGWDEDRRHSTNSLHYEGRAVDITTSDKDRSKYGLLARLAVEAGFDWVHYESRSHVHCSVKSEKADSIRNNACFDAESLVETPMGQMEMSQLQTNDLVLTMNSQTGELQFSPVLMWLDRDESNSELFVNLTTKSGKQIRLTSSHLIYLADEPLSSAPDAFNPVNGDLSSKDTNEGRSAQTNDRPTSGNNYYYDLVGVNVSGNEGPGSLQESTVLNQSNLSTGKATSESSSSSLLDNVVPSRSQIMSASDGPSSPRPLPTNPHQNEELNDYVYTTYARNAVVGQYLLIHEPNERIEFGVTSRNDKGSVASQRVSTPNRLPLSSGQDTNEIGSVVSPASKKIRKYKYNNQQKPTRTKAKVVFDEIVSVKYVPRHGIYAPLTREGNIVVNSVVASCYAVISDHDMAHWSMAPVRWLSLIKEKLFGLNPETPTHERTVDYTRRMKLYEERRKLSNGVAQWADNQHEGARHMPDYNTTNSLNRTPASDSRHIHWYPVLLYNIARYVLPNNYLY